MLVGATESVEVEVAIVVGQALDEVRQRAQRGLRPDVLPMRVPVVLELVGPSRAPVRRAANRGDQQTTLIGYRRLERNGSSYRLTAIGSTQLRFEGIDALELHYEGSHQPRPLADEGRDALTGALDLNPVPYVLPGGIRVRPPCERDKTPGFILSRALEAHGRPVAFAFKGEPPKPDGSEVFLKAGLLRRSLNYKALAGGHAYPLYYDTLFAELRTTLTAAAGSARDAGEGIWAHDVSTKGLAIGTQADLERDGVVFPKLFRRLTEYIKDHPNDPAGFPGWLDDKREQVLDTTTDNFTHLDDVIETKANKVKMLRRPEELVFVSAKTTSRAVAPWLAV